MGVFHIFKIVEGTKLRKASHINILQSEIYFLTN